MMIPTTSEAQLHREFARLKALDVAGVNAALRKYIDTAHAVEIFAGDFKDAKP